MFVITSHGGVKVDMRTQSKMNSALAEIRKNWKNISKY